MPLGTAPASIEVDSSAKVRQSCELAVRLADSLGFPAAHCQEIGLVATELGTNLLRHASRGTMTISALPGGDPAGIRIETEDSGPGIHDVEQAIADGYSTAGGLGLGLGTVNRLMDELEVASAPGGGLHVVCQRWARPPLTGAFDRRLPFGVATRACRRSKENGDTFLIRQWDGKALVGVIDGLGHGHFAQRAALSARQYVEQHFDQPLDKLFRGAGRACRATRGVVMALARFDLERKRVELASVGHIEVRLAGTSEKLNLHVRRGIVGLNAPEAVVTENPWTGAGWLVMHSDGLTSRWDWEQFREVAHQAPSAIAQRMLLTLGKPDDDATVVVVGKTSA